MSLAGFCGINDFPCQLSAYLFGSQRVSVILDCKSQGVTTARECATDYHNIFRAKPLQILIEHWAPHAFRRSIAEV